VLMLICSLLSRLSLRFYSSADRATMLSHRPNERNQAVRIDRNVNLAYDSPP
jgi:hypothetical protein